MEDALGFILDCDGVLLDSIDAWYEAEEAVARIGGVTLTQADADVLNRLTIREAGRHFHETLGLGESADAVVRLIDECMQEFYSERVTACSGALEFVRAMHERGAALAVVSSSPSRYLNAGLERAGFTPFLAGILSADDLRTSKREPLIFDQARKLLGTRKARTWGLDDTAYALHTLRQAGYRTCGIFSNEKNSTPDALAAAAEVSFAGGMAECTPCAFLEKVATLA